MERCPECGKEFKKGYHGYCKECYAKIWDSSFDSTSDNAYKVGFDELVKNLDSDDVSEKENSMKEIISEWGPLEWRCPECNAVRINREDSAKLSADDKINILSKECSCGSGRARPIYPKKYFH